MVGRGRARDAETYERVERSVQAPLLILSLVLVPLLILPEVVNLSAAGQSAVEAASWLIWAVFAAEYLVLLWLAPDRGHMIRTHIFDLIVIVVPFLRPLRGLRGLRLLRCISALAVGGSALRRIMVRRGFGMFLSATMGLLVAGAALTFAFERSHPDSNLTSFVDALWWALVTSTTVGYGDHFPVTAEGRAIAVLLMLLGVGLLSVVTANVAAYFVEHDDKDQLGELRAELAVTNARLAAMLARLDGIELEGASRSVSEDEPT